LALIAATDFINCGAMVRAAGSLILRGCCLIECSFIYRSFADARADERNADHLVTCVMWRQRQLFLTAMRRCLSMVLENCWVRHVMWRSLGRKVARKRPITSRLRNRLYCEKITWTIGLRFLMRRGTNALLVFQT